MSTELDNGINARLAAFGQDTANFMNAQPPKFDQDGQAVEGDTLFPPETIADNGFVEARDTARQLALAQGSRVTARAASTANDNAANLVDNLKHTKLQDMEAANLKEAKLAESPWSDDYWAIYKGVLGARYADPNFPESDDWKKNADYIIANPASDILKSRSATRINRLSPSEKYDALVGDANGSLTQAMWMDGKRYYDANGSVETWMGICHGWAPAAYMLSRPTKPVTLLTPDNIPIKFYPADIKALASLLWANVPAKTRFIGGRCNDKDPETDQATGRLTSEKCFDTNPGTWHLAVVNQIGVSRRSMVFDVTFDYEVWNQPVYGYQYTYFNPQTRRATTSLAEAKVAMASYTNDKFKRFRSSQSRSVVGISMTVSYIVETAPQHREDDRPEYDAIRQVQYEYDLELDANDVIIGGEWYRNRHPDFLWTPPKGAQAQTRFESGASGNWPDQRRPIPTSWRVAATQASSQQKSPLAKIVEQIIEFANTGSSSTASTAIPTMTTPEATTPTAPVTPTAPTTPTTPPVPPTTPTITPTPTTPAQPGGGGVTAPTGTSGAGGDRGTSSSTGTNSGGSGNTPTGSNLLERLRSWLRSWF